MPGVPALAAVQHEVLDPDIPEGAPHHDLVVPSAGAEGVELPGLHAPVLEPPPGGLRLRDGTGGRDVVRGGHVAQDREDPGAPDVGGLGEIQRHSLEEGRIPDVGGIGVPVVERRIPFGKGKGLPELVALEHLGVPILVHLRLQGVANGVADLLLRGPDVAKVDGLTVGPGAQGLGGQVHVDASGQGEGHHQHGGGQVVGPDQGMDAGLEVPVPREHRGHHEALLLHGFGNGLGQRPRVADAGGAPVSHDVKSQLLEVGEESGRREVVGHHLGTRSQRRLDPGQHGEPLLGGSLRQEAGAHHDRGIRGIGAGGDGSDDDAPIGELHGVSVHLHRDRPGASITVHNGGRVTGPSGGGGPHRRISPVGRDLVLASPFGGPVGGGTVLGLVLPAVVVGEGEALGEEPRKLIPEGAREGRKRHPVLGTSGAGQGGDNAGKVQVHHRGENGVRGLVGAEEMHLPGDPLHAGNELGAPTRPFQVLERLCIHGKEADGGAVLGRHVGNGGPVSEPQRRKPLAEELHEAPHHAVLPKEFGDPEHQVGGGGPLGEGARDPHAHHFGEEHVVGLPQEDGLGLDPAHAPPDDAQAVDHRGVGVSADQGVGVGQVESVFLAAVHDGGEVLEVHLVHDPGARRNHAEVAEGVLPPAQELVALPVPLHLLLDVHSVGIGGAEEVHLHRVVDDHVGGNHGVDPLCRAPEGMEAGAHGGEVDHRRHTGEVLQHHPGGHEGEVGPGVGGTPRAHRLHVVGGHIAATRVPEGILQQDADGKGHPVQVDESILCQLSDAEVGGLPLGQVEVGEGSERVLATGGGVVCAVIGHGGSLERGRWCGTASKHTKSWGELRPPFRCLR